MPPISPNNDRNFVIRQGIFLGTRTTFIANVPDPLFGQIPGLSTDEFIRLTTSPTPPLFYQDIFQNAQEALDSPPIQNGIGHVGNDAVTYTIPSIPDIDEVGQGTLNTTSPDHPEIDTLGQGTLNTTPISYPEIDSLGQSTLNTTPVSYPEIDTLGQQTLAQVPPPGGGSPFPEIDRLGQEAIRPSLPGTSDIERIGRGALETPPTPSIDVDKFSQALGNLTQQADGTYRRENDTSVYIPQPDGTLYRTAGRYSRPGQPPVDLPARTLYFDGEALRESTDAIRPWTRAILRLGLIRQADSTYRLPGEGNTGRVLLQPDGTLFHEGGTMGGLVVGPGTYVVTNPATGEGAWQRAGAHATPRPGTLAIAALGLIPGRTAGQWVSIPQAGQTPFGHYTVTTRADIDANRHYGSNEGDLQWTGGTDPNTGIKHPWLIARYNPTSRQIEYYRSFSDDGYRKLYRVYTEPDPANAEQRRYYCVDPDNTANSWYYNRTTDRWVRRSGS